LVDGIAPQESRTQLVPEGFDGPRACGPFELPGVLDLVNLVIRTLNTPAGSPPRWPSMGADFPHVYHVGNLDNIRVIVRDGRVATSVGIYSTLVRTPRGDLLVGGINAMATHPDARRLGLGNAVMEDAAAKMRSDGHQIALLGTRIQDWYRRMDWESAGQQWRFVFDRGNIAYLPAPAELEVIEDWRPHAADLCALHNIEPLGALRSEMIFTLLAERRLSRVFVARQNGRVVAYAGTSGTTVNEYAGAAEDVAALIRAIFDRLDDRSTHTSERPPGQRATIELMVTTPVATEGLPGLLGTRGIPSTLTYQGMIKILDAPGLFRALDLREIDLERHDEGWRVHHRGQLLDLSERQLVKLVFGPERFPDFAPGVFPVPFFQWTVDHV